MAFRAQRLVYTQTRMVRRELAAGLLLLSGCLGGSDEVELPAGWEDAERVSQFVQSECTGSGFDDAVDSANAIDDGDVLRVRYEDAHFRCDQAVEGFVRRVDGRVEVLVQPQDLDPAMVARCDCTYDITFELQASANATELVVFRRWDNLNDHNDPVQVARLLLKEPVCEFGADQSCNDNPSISSLHGACLEDGRCECAMGFEQNPTTGRCL